MKKKISFILACITILACFTSCQQEVTSSNDSVFVFKKIEGGYSVCLTEESYDKNFLIIPSTYKGEKVIRIEDYAFEDDTQLENIIIPDSITSIGCNAFFFCSGLNQIIIPKNVTSIEANAFAYCPAQIVFAEGTTAIPDEAITNSLTTSIIIPESVTSIGETAFCCENLKSIIIPKNVACINDYAFSSCLNLEDITLQDGLESIGRNVFYCCLSLKSIQIPSTVSSITENTFLYCISLEHIAVDKNNLTFESVDGVLFNKKTNTICSYPGHKSNTSYSIPDGVEVIGLSSLSDAYNLEILNLPKSLSTIEDGSIQYNVYISTINVDEDNPTFSSLDGILFSKDKTELLFFPNKSSKETYSIPDTVVTIASTSFYKTSLSSLEIPSSVTTIEEEAFSFNSLITELTIPETVTTIGSENFSNFSALKTVHVKSGSTAASYTGYPLGCSVVEDL